MDGVLARMWTDLIGRLTGPLTLRLYLQPAMATIYAVRDGLKDAREGRPAYLWSVFTHPDERRRLIAEGWKSIGKIFVLAVERTRLAHERTLMAWVRTGTSLISFGFTIYKFFQYLRESQHAAAAGVIGPREFALLMIAVGIIALLFATVGHIRSMRTLRAEYGPLIPYSMSTLVAALVGLLGLLSLLAVYFRQ